jgi:glutathione S-transferase
MPGCVKFNRMVNDLLKGAREGDAVSEPSKRTATPVLWHLKVSHYNEKARWALDYKGIPHVRRAVLPGRHAKVAEGLGAGRTFPVLQLDGDVLGDSTLIIHSLERRQPDPPLYPADPADARRALEIEDFFDEKFGPYLRLLVLAHMLPDAGLLLGAFAPDLTGPQRVAARAMYPLTRRKIAADFGIDGPGVERAWAKCRLACRRFAVELQPSGYLVGEDFTVADLTVAALLSPVVAPEQFPYPQPQRDHPRFADLRRMIDESGALEWARGIYARHRPATSEISR